eukprot:jgi/Mesen1/5932/ME000301S05067
MGEKRTSGGRDDNKRSKRGKKKHFGAHKKPYCQTGVFPGVEGFLISCFSGKEFASSREVINVLDEFWEKATGTQKETAKDEESKEGLIEGQGEGEEGTEESEEDEEDEEDENETGGSEGVGGGEKSEGAAKEAAQDAPACVSANTAAGGGGGSDIDKLLEQEMEGIRTLQKVRFSHIDTGCKGLTFVRMKRQKGAAGPGPAQLAEAVARDVASTRRTRTRYTLKLLPAEASSYASTGAIQEAIAPVLARHFPAAAAKPLKFAILLEARAHAGLDKMDIIKGVASLVPAPHSVDLSNPDRTILLQIVKTTCVMGVVADFKALSKYNLQQLAAPAKEDKEQVSEKQIANVEAVDSLGRTEAANTDGLTEVAAPDGRTELAKAESINLNEAEAGDEAKL